MVDAAHHDTFILYFGCRNGSISVIIRSGDKKKKIVNVYRPGSSSEVLNGKVVLA